MSNHVLYYANLNISQYTVVLVLGYFDCFNISLHVIPLTTMLTVVLTCLVKC